MRHWLPGAAFLITALGGLAAALRAVSGWTWPEIAGTLAMGVVVAAAAVALYLKAFSDKP